MTDDIVKRLREGIEPYDGLPDAEAVMDEAADEIERLRAGITAIQQATFQHYDTVWFDKVTTMHAYCEELLHPVSSGQEQMPHPIRCPYCNADPSYGEAHKPECQALTSDSTT